jgi:hypothetical protein
MSDRGKRRNNRRDKQKIKSDEKEKDKEKDNERERSRDKEKEKEKVKSYEDKKNNFSSKNENEKEDKKNKSEKILNNILLTNDKNDQSNLIILPLENSSKELNQYSSVHVNKQALLNLLKCPLCKGYYRTPYTINECMHTFCRSCIFKYFGYSNQREQCPVCNTKIGGRPMDSLIFDNYLDSLLNILFPQFEEIDKINRQKLYKTYRDAGSPLPGDEEEAKLLMPNTKIYIMPENKNENKFNGSFLVPKNFDISSIKELIAQKEEGLQKELIGVNFKDNEILNNYTMDVIDNQYGFDQDKNIFYYYIKKKKKK